MTEDYMFDGSHNTTHIPDEIRVRERLQALHEVETYLTKKCKQKNIEVSRDCSANEKLNWDTINYTSYCGLLYISTLCRTSTLCQFYDAAADNLDSIGHIDFIRKNITNKLGSKYVVNTNSDNKEFKLYEGNKFKAVCVLPGHNKFYTLSNRKLKTIQKHWGKDLLFKLHPITCKKVLKKIGFFKGINESQLADTDVDLYDLIYQAEHVYSTHVSETALTSLILGKTIEPIDDFDKRMNSSFSALNHFCYNYSDAVYKLDKIFASFKSGIIHPEVDKNWKDKIDQYLEYVLEKREIQNGFYL